MVDLLKPINVLLVQLLWLAVGAAGPEDASSSLVILTGANHAHFWTLLNLLDTTCSYPASAHVAGQYITTAAGTKIDRVCSAVTMCDYSNQYELKD